MVYQLVIGFILCNQSSNIVALLCNYKKNLNIFNIGGAKNAFIRTSFHKIMLPLQVRNN